MADVGWDALQLEGLEARPAEAGGVRGDEFSQVLDEALVNGTGAGSLDLRGRMLADCLV